MPRWIRETNNRDIRVYLQKLLPSKKPAHKAWPGIAVESNGEVRVSRSALSRLHPLLQRLALRRGYVLVTGDATRLKESHMVAMEDLAVDKRGGRSLDLPAGVVLRQEYKQLVLARTLEADCPYPNLGGEYPVELPVETGVDRVGRVGPWLVVMHSGKASQPPDWANTEDDWPARLKASAIGPDAVVRTWRPGDRIQPLGMQGHKKLQDLYTCLLYTSPSPRDATLSRMPSSA